LGYQQEDRIKPLQMKFNTKYFKQAFKEQRLQHSIPV